MHSKCLFKHFSSFPKLHIHLLAVLWGAGLLVGILLSTTCSGESIAVLHGALATSASPLLLFFTIALPVAVTILSLTTPLFVLSYPAAFLTAVCHGFCGILIYLAQGNCSWLLRPMILFTSSCTSVLMWWLLIRNCKGRRAHFGADIRLAGILFCCIFVVDLFVISPLLTDLTKYF